MQAIETKYMGPTNHRGSRVKAKCEGGQITVSWNYALNSQENHAAAIEALMERLDWEYNYYLGATENGYRAVLV